MNQMHLERTVKVELLVNQDQSGRLLAIRPLVTEAFNAATKHAWEHPEASGSVDLHRALYRPLRDATPLPSQFLCNVFRRASGAVNTTRKREARGQKVSCPEATNLPIPYDARSMSLRPDRKSATIATLTGRIEVQIRRHRQLRRYSDWKTDSGNISQSSDGRFWLALCLTKDVSEPAATGTVVGCDRGIVVPAVLSTGEFLGDPNHHQTDRRYFKTQRELQAKGTKSAKRRLHRRSGRWSRFRAWADHNITRQILSRLAPGTTLALEDLTNIRVRGRRFRRNTRRRMHAWSFRRQQEMLKYKAPEVGVQVALIDARYTSQRCSSCGHTEKQNRPTRALFRCTACGHSEHADLNAAKNIAQNWTASQQTGGPPVVGRKTRVSPPHVAHAKDPRSQKAGTALRGSGAAKRLHP